MMTMATTKVTLLTQRSYTKAAFQTLITRSSTATSSHFTRNIFSKSYNYYTPRKVVSQQQTLQFPKSSIRITRRTIVTQLSPTTSLLRNNKKDNEVYLIGTAHISQESANEVRDMIQLVKPNKVFVELDYQRAMQLRSDFRDADGGRGGRMSAVEDALEKNVRNLMFSLGGGGGGGGGGSGSGGALLNNNLFQRAGGGGAGGEDMLKSAFRGFYKLLRKYGYMPGIEMKTAMDEAAKINADIVYGDVNVNETMRDLKTVLTPSLILELMHVRPPPELEQIIQDAIMNQGGSSSNSNHDLEHTVEAIKTREYASLMTKWMDDSMPDVADVMIHKRDETMANNLRLNCGEGKIVAVVGLAHVDGIEREWENL